LAKDGGDTKKTSSRAKRGGLLFLMQEVSNLKTTTTQRPGIKRLLIHLSVVKSNIITQLTKDCGLMITLN